MEIRPLRPADIPELALMLSVLEPWTYYGVDAAAWERSLKAIPKDELGYVGLAEGQIVAYVQFTLGGTFALSGYVRTLAVRAGQKGGGLGRQILSFAEQMILTRGPNVFLLCSARNTAAQAFYKAIGYVEAGRLPAYVLPTEEEIIFRKTAGPIHSGNAGR